MNATNRVANRIVLLLAAVLLLGGGLVLIAAGLAARGVRADWAGLMTDRILGAWSEFSASTIVIGVFGAVSIATIVAFAAAISVLALLIVFLMTRGGGRTSDAWVQESATGSTIVDRSVADALLGAPMRSRPDVVSANVATYVVSGQRAVELAVRVQPNARLDAVVAAAETAVDSWDALLDERTPVVVHLSDRSWRDAFRSRTRVG